MQSMTELAPSTDYKGLKAALELVISIPCTDLLTVEQSTEGIPRTSYKPASGHLSVNRQKTYQLLPRTRNKHLGQL